MPRKKLKLNASEEEIEKLIKALKAGSPLNLALQFSHISTTTYYYWVAMYSVVVEIKSQDELESLKADKYGISIDSIKEIAADNAAKKKSAMGAFIEPRAESLLKYRNDAIFRNFAKQCYDIIVRCNETRAEAALGHLAAITKSVQDKRVNASGSMWFLERTLSEFFSKPNEKNKEESESKVPVEKVQLEFINPDKKEDKDRILQMEELILSEQKGIGQS